MISKETFNFLRDLANNNNKIWFDENRTQYTAIRSGFEQFISFVISEIALFDDNIKYVTAKNSIFRINRDIRFSSDKSPYKTNFGAYISKGGRKSPYAGYYIHIEPNASFLAGGIYMPSGDVLKVIRKEIYENFEEFKEIIDATSFKQHFGNKLLGEKLKSSPKGYPKDFSGIEYVKYKQFTVVKNVPDHLYFKKGCIAEIRNVFSVMKPFNDFLNRAVENLE